MFARNLPASDKFGGRKIKICEVAPCDHMMEDQLDIAREKPKGKCLKIRGIPVDFCYTPYGAQITMMDQVE